MTNTVSKYFAGELAPEKMGTFLLEVANNKNLEKEFIEVQQLIVYVNLLFGKRDEEKVQEHLLHFMQRLVKNKE